ncbi:polygalacturonase non-catalytic subunit AroGP3-like [Selaginella moellendorffii]|uniref:polygalacturonase non-catalytic subunit AroGP3-like n=1 Tax=Selaginella moellendorffii TaxID=88036 RepID=UPI000D1C7C5C|nr:polygalacturonase non-catalytic subunit AroGP3-like [Selaginella moellendorffii]|eukprot:XP_024514722.1 polygalacturonase non-catalytic subunit AroGP3-like [Selaginella moellendorffii]
MDRLALGLSLLFSSLLLSECSDIISTSFANEASPLGAFESARFGEQMRRGVFTADAKLCHRAGFFCHPYGRHGGNAHFGDAAEKTALAASKLGGNAHFGDFQDRVRSLEARDLGGNAQFGDFKDHGALGGNAHFGDFHKDHGLGGNAHFGDTGLGGNAHFGDFKDHGSLGGNAHFGDFKLDHGLGGNAHFGDFKDHGSLGGNAHFGDFKDHGLGGNAHFGDFKDHGLGGNAHFGDLKDHGLGGNAHFGDFKDHGLGGGNAHFRDFKDHGSLGGNTHFGDFKDHGLGGNAHFGDFKDQSLGGNAHFGDFKDHGLGGNAHFGDFKDKSLGGNAHFGDFKDHDNAHFRDFKGLGGNAHFGDFKDHGLGGNTHFGDASLGGNAHFGDASVKPSTSCKKNMPLYLIQIFTEYEEEGYGGRKSLHSMDWPTIKALIAKCSPGMLHHFFTLEELRQRNGTESVLPNIRDTYPPRALLPSAMAKHTNFGKRSLDSYLKEFNVPKESPLARKMAFTLELCNDNAGGKMKCVASMEEMAEFVTSTLGPVEITMVTGSKAFAAEVGKTIKLGEVKPITKGDTLMVVCHTTMFPYKVYFCHKVSSTSASKVNVKTSSGMELTPNVLCHKMGKTYVCHWFVETVIMFVPIATVYA